MDVLIIFFVFLIFALALLGVFLPMLPGVPLAWAGLLAYAIHTDFQSISSTSIWIFLGLTLLTIIFDLLAPVIGAKRYNASPQGIIGSTIGLFLGIFILGPFGIIFGPLIGAFVGEMLSGKHPRIAFRSASGAFLGFLAGSLIKLSVILIMLGFFLASIF